MAPKNPQQPIEKSPLWVGGLHTLRVQPATHGEPDK